MHGGAKQDNITRARQGDAFYPIFDYLRILAAVGVFYSHALLDEKLLPANFGSACVQLFFALSGFLIGNILIAPGFSPSRFYFNRATRIWIPYYIAIVLVIIGTAAKQSLLDPKIWEFLFYKATFVYNFFGVPQTVEFGPRMPLFGSATHFWSISVEEQFYLVAPLLILFLPRAVIWMALTVVILGRLFVPHDFAAISLGLLLALSRERFGIWYAGLSAKCAIAGIAVTTSLLLATGHVSFSTAVPIIAVSVIALTAIEGRQQLIGKLLGGASYSFYLNHWIGLYAIKPIMGLLKIGLGGAAFLACGVTLLIGLGHFILIDTWIARQRSKWYTEKLGWLLCTFGFGLVTAGVIGGLLIGKVVSS
jgi:peptidoglycan/LPS O-acetylase OafA/YrhL